MKKSEIVFVDSTPLSAHCSTCKDVKFFLERGMERKHRTHQESDLRAAFDRHYMQVHLYEGNAEAAIAELKRSKGQS
jgi:hypothetical protein